MPAGDIRTSREVNVNEASNQQLTTKKAVEGPTLAKHLAVAEVHLGSITLYEKRNYHRSHVSYHCNGRLQQRAVE
jgi:hypothetical protein